MRNVYVERRKCLCGTSIGMSMWNVYVECRQFLCGMSMWKDVNLYAEHLCGMSMWKYVNVYVECLCGMSSISMRNVYVESLCGKTWMSMWKDVDFYVECLVYGGLYVEWEVYVELYVYVERLVNLENVYVECLCGMSCLCGEYLCGNDLSIWSPMCHGWVMSHMWMSHVTYVNASCRTCECVSCYLCECVMSHVWTNMWRVTCMNESSHMWVSLVTHVNESCHTHQRVMSHCYQSIHVAHANGTCRLYGQVTSCHWQVVVTLWQCHTMTVWHYGVAAISRLLASIILFCRI